MREIKFRAFDKKTRHMDYELATTTCLGHDLNNQQGIPNRVSELMQYTGLKDKNGKEIYEGDILVVKDQNDEMFSVDREGNERLFMDCGIAVVRFEFGMWYLNEEINNALYDVIESENNCEVIGNVYKNPDLLND